MTSSILSDRHTVAVQQIDAWVHESVPDAQRLDAGQLKGLGIDLFPTGWRLPLPDGGDFILLLDPAFPHSLPRVVIHGRDALLQSAHVERGGLLCLAPPNSKLDGLDPVALVRHAITDAINLIDDLPQHAADLKIDFEAYWRRAPDLSGLEFRSLLILGPPSRRAKAWHGEAFYLVAENSEDCLRWLVNRSGPDISRKVNDSFVVWLEELPLPQDYPITVPNLRDMIERTSVDAAKDFDAILAQAPHRLAVVLMGKTPDGRIASAAVVLDKPENTAQKSRVVKNPANKGFRPGRVPPEVLAPRYRLRRVEVDHVDAARTRMDRRVTESLENKRVMLIGCGALGAGVARLLVQSGLKRLHLVDLEKLAWANIGRHELGAEWVGKNKATALANHLRRRMPQIIDIGSDAASWRTALERNSELFSTTDMVIMATGDWNADSCRATIWMRLRDNLDETLPRCWG